MVVLVIGGWGWRGVGGVNALKPLAVEVDRFSIELFFALEQTHCALLACGCECFSFTVFNPFTAVRSLENDH